MTARFSRGWPLVGWASVTVAAAATLTLWRAGAGEEGVRQVLRLTARTSGFLFLVAFVASALRKTWRNSATKWLVTNRRYVGVSFAASHAIHLMAIVALALIVPDPYDPVTLVMGGVGYGLILAMTLTSSDAAVSRMGLRRWKQLHTAGIYYLWVVFTFTFAGGAGADPIAAVFTAGFVAALVFRLIAGRGGIARDGAVIPVVGG
jgi:DMSO/TMAO reductase YedYZ heme-binding membrane subunit